MSPTPNMAAAASTTPNISGDPSKSGRNAGTAAAASTATKNPRSIAAPPP